MADDSEKKARGILKAFDDVLAHPNWEKSVFLRAVAQKIQEIRDRFRQDTNLSDTPEQAHPSSGTVAGRVAEREGQIEVFVSLYCANGTMINNWEKVLQGLHRQVITRPIFEKEEELRELIRAKSNPKNEAYVSAYIPKAAIMKPPSGRQPTDTLGHKLLIIREGTITQNHVNRFVHHSGVYNYHEGKLVKTDEENDLSEA